MGSVLLRQKLTASKLKAGVGSGDSRPTAVAQLTDVLRDSPDEAAHKGRPADPGLPATGCTYPKTDRRRGFGFRALPSFAGLTPTSVRAPVPSRSKASTYLRAHGKEIPASLQALELVRPALREFQPSAATLVGSN